MTVRMAKVMARKSTYTGIKMEVVEWSPAAKEAVGGKVGGRKVFLVAATLRPETMCVIFVVVRIATILD